MGAPNINIIFSHAAEDVAALSARGTVALLVKDTAETGGHVLRSVKDIPAGLSQENRDYIARAFDGYVEKPSRVLVYVLNSGEEEDIQTGLTWLGTQIFDWMAGAPDCSEEDAGKIVTWIKEQRGQRRIAKAVLPNHEADCYAVVNFAGEELKAGEKSFTAAQYCSRIAGLIAGTPYTHSCTYAPLRELSDCKHLSIEDEGAAVDAGKLVPIHDGVKVKLSRGVTSMTTVEGEGVTEDFKKIKIVEIRDRIEYTLRQLFEDEWVGKYPNTYDNECIFVTAVTSFFSTLEAEGLVRPGWSASYDVSGKRTYLEGKGVDTADLTDDDIKQYDAGSNVFILVDGCKILDAIEDAQIRINLI